MTGQEARDAGAEKVPHCVASAEEQNRLAGLIADWVREHLGVEHVLFSTRFGLARTILNDGYSNEGYGKHPEPEITDEQARAVMTVDAIAQSTSMSRADVIATVKAIGEPLHGWEFGHEVSLHTGVTIHPVGDERTARTLAWLHPVYRRHAPGPWVPAGEGEQ